jgi:hypothetical protein
MNANVARGDHYPAPEPTDARILPEPSDHFLIRQVELKRFADAPVCSALQHENRAVPPGQL